MANTLRQGLSWLADARSEHMSEDVVYYKNGTAISLVATIGRSEYPIIDDEGRQFTKIVFDFIVRSADLICDELVCIPEVGDYLLYASKRYNVIANYGEQCYKVTGYSTRIHTEYVGV